MWIQRKLDFQGYRSKNFVSKLSRLMHTYHEVKTCLRNPGELLVNNNA